MEQGKKRNGEVTGAEIEHFNLCPQLFPAPYSLFPALRPMPYALFRKSCAWTTCCMVLLSRGLTVSRRISQLHDGRRSSRLRALPDSSAVVRVGGSRPPDTCAEDRPSTSAENPGAILRVAREALGLSLVDLSRATKISTSLLSAVEQMRFDRLPALIYTRGFIKAYAREVGLDAEEIASRYFAGTRPVEPP